MARIHTYPNQPNLYAIVIDDKIFNLVLNYHGTKPSSYTGGIVQYEGPMDDIEFPHNILMDNYPIDYQKHGTILYDKWATNDGILFEYKGTQLNIDKLDVSEPADTQIDDALIKTIKKIEIQFEKLRRLFNQDDSVFQDQWFLDYVDFSEFKDMHVTDENREIEITKIIRTIHKLSTQFQINNNHQMKLFFQIFLNLKDTGETEPPSRKVEETPPAPAPPAPAPPAPAPPAPAPPAPAPPAPAPPAPAPPAPAPPAP